MPQKQHSEYDVYLFHEGSLFQSYKFLGAHIHCRSGMQGVMFRVFAPNAQLVRLTGDFNHWNGTDHQLERVNADGIWSIFVPGLQIGTVYKYEIVAEDGTTFLKSDPYAFFSELRPKTASIVFDLSGYEWKDSGWQQTKCKPSHSYFQQPINIYEVHAGTWKRQANGDFYTYRELADELIPYVKHLGYTHIELMPLAEHPYDRSWGYQITGYYAVTSRYGTPHDFMYFVDRCHQAGIGVFLDWVPSHFGKDDHGLRRFDGTALYEYEDPKKAEKKDWGTLSFDYGKPEIISFLISNALFWLDLFHIDGLRVDAVSSMLYLDFSKAPFDWTPNRYGGRENLEAISFLKKLNQVIHKFFPHTIVMAEESTDWPSVTGDLTNGGLGFPFKWNMGWMNDTLRYIEMDPIYRKHQHNLLTFPIHYAFSERFILPLSHDEVIHGKRSLLNKNPGDYWKKFAGLRLLFGYQMTHPGKKLVFMGGEFGQFDEWKDQEQLDWNLLAYEKHHQLFTYVSDLNHLYLREKSLWQCDHIQSGYEWIDPHDMNQSVITFCRKGKKPSEFLVIVCNFTPVFYPDYRIGVPKQGIYYEAFNSDLHIYGGSGQVNLGLIRSEPVPWHNHKRSISICLPPLAIVIFKKTARKGEQSAGRKESTI